MGGPFCVYVCLFAFVYVCLRLQIKTYAHLTNRFSYEQLHKCTDEETFRPDLYIHIHNAYMYMYICV